MFTPTASSLFRIAVLLALLASSATGVAAASPAERAAAPAEAATAARRVDHGAWRRVLARHLRPGSKNGVELVLVDYGALSRGDADLAAYLRLLARSDPASLPPAEATALWINAYNALAVKMVADGWPVASIRDLGGKLFGRVWDRPAGVVGGKRYSLDDIEHRILRPQGDPRIHAALVCASVSCPDLRREPFTGDRLEGLLDEQTRAFLAHPGKGARFDRAEETLYLSKIFDWFGDDFAAVGGVLRFVRLHAPEALARHLDAHPAPRVRYLDYDWQLNGP